MDNECFFKWKFNCDNSDLREVGPALIETIIKYSKEYEDGAHTELEAKLKDDSNLKLKCHRNCASSYTSAEHLKRHKKRSGLGTETAPIPKKRRRSGNLKFLFKEHCIFCGEVCQLERDIKNPTRWRRAVLCRTATRPGQKTFKESILDICTKRNDEQAHQVRSRVEGALSDLHTADGRYHVDSV